MARIPLCSEAPSQVHARCMKSAIAGRTRPFLIAEGLRKHRRSSRSPRNAASGSLLCTSEEAKTHQTAFLSGPDGENSANLFVLDLIEAKVL